LISQFLRGAWVAIFQKPRGLEPSGYAERPDRLAQIGVDCIGRETEFLGYLLRAPAASDKRQAAPLCVGKPVE
jgi:hypothetical protein